MERFNYEYPCCPAEPWPLLKYRVSLNRASSYYEVFIIFPARQLPMAQRATMARDSSTLTLGAQVTTVVLTPATQMLWPVFCLHAS